MQQQQQPSQAESDLSIINAIRSFMERDTRLMPSEINTFVACGEYLGMLAEAAKAKFIEESAREPEPKAKRTTRS